MSRVVNVFAGLLIGALIGAGLVVLFAPRSGAKTRQMIQDQIELILDEGRQAAEERQRELSAQFEVLKQPKA
jgi:gas vesicle protein